MAGMPRACAILALAAALACDGGGEATPTDSKAPAPVVTVSDAGPPLAHAADEAARVPGAEPSSEFHLDNPDVAYGRPSRRAARAPARPAPAHIHMILRSTPPGAVAAVDGSVVGHTPAYWEGEANGKPREVTFVLPGHAMARYRFIPVTSGTIHGRLEKLRVELPDAGPPPGPGEIPIPGYPNDL